jgi:hypothetical protein
MKGGVPMERYVTDFTDVPCSYANPAGKVAEHR